MPRRSLLGHEQFLARPIAHAVLAHEDPAGRTAPQGVGESVLPSLAGNQAPLVQPRGLAGGLELLRDAFHQRFIGAVVRQEDVEL